MTTEKCVRCMDSDATERGSSVPYVGAPLCARCAAELTQDDEDERETDEQVDEVARSEALDRERGAGR